LARMSCQVDAKLPTRLQANCRWHRVQCMYGICAEIGQCCRQMVGVLVVYTLILHGFAFSVATAGMAATATPIISFEMCLHDKGAQPKSPEAPRTGNGERCAFCLAACAHFFTPPMLALLGTMFVAGNIAWQPISNWHPLPFTATVTRSHEALRSDRDAERQPSV